MKKNTAGAIAPAVLSKACQKPTKKTFAPAFTQKKRSKKQAIASAGCSSKNNINLKISDRAGIFLKNEKLSFLWKDFYFLRNGFVLKLLR